jgi:hypothetical protein
VMVSVLLTGNKWEIGQRFWVVLPTDRVRDPDRR